MSLKPNILPSIDQNETCFEPSAQSLLKAELQVLILEELYNNDTREVEKVVFNSNASHAMGYFIVGLQSDTENDWVRLTKEDRINGEPYFTVNIDREGDMFYLGIVKSLYNTEVEW